MIDTCRKGNFQVSLVFEVLESFLFTLYDSAVLLEPVRDDDVTDKLLDDHAIVLVLSNLFQLLDHFLVETLHELAHLEPWTPLFLYIDHELSRVDEEIVAC